RAVGGVVLVPTARIGRTEVEARTEAVASFLGDPAIEVPVGIAATEPAAHGAREGSESGAEGVRRRIAGLAEETPGVLERIESDVVHVVRQRDGEAGAVLPYRGLAGWRAAVPVPPLDAPAQLPRMQVD